MIGKTISHYKISEVLGLGTMSTVYKALDLNLNRQVALKFLPAHKDIDEIEKKRLIREARTTSALDHPNICTIYEIGETEDGRVFIAMAYYDGQTLKDMVAEKTLSIKETVNIGVQAGKGLSKAHEKGIVHRDIKSANIIITSEGVVKIVDFGIATLVNKTSYTKLGTIIGTPGYMSPEQARGDIVDHRTDIWSLGVVLYEIQNGYLPFKGEYDVAIINSILNDDPAPMNMPDTDEALKLKKIILKALARHPADRYQEVDELVADLSSMDRKSQTQDETRTVTIKTKKIPSIAVLPFLDLSSEKDQAYFCDGLAEEIISKLTRLQGLRVVSRTSTFQFKDKEIDLADVGRRLNILTVLEGSVRKSGPKIRISTRLISIRDGYLLWTEEFNLEMGDIFQIQDDISQAVLKALKIKLAIEQKTRLFKRYTNNVSAYSKYLKGRYHWNKRIKNELIKSIDYYKRAIDEDSGYALAYAGLADTYTILGIYGALPPSEVMPKAKAAVIKALKIDEDLAEARISLGCIHAVYNRDWQQSEIEFKRGIELNPGYALGHHWYSVNYLSPNARFNEALKEMGKALELDPISLVVNMTVGLTHYYARDYDKAIIQLNKTLELDSNFAMAHFFLAQARVQKNQFNDAFILFSKAFKLFGESVNIYATYANAIAQSGNKNKALQMLEKLQAIASRKYVSSYDTAIVYSGMGDREQAINCLYKAYEESAYLLTYIKVDPLLDSLRDESRFKTLINKVFPETNNQVIHKE